MIKVHELQGTIQKVGTITGEIKQTEKLSGNVSVPQTVRVSDYDKLDNKPQINSVTLEGNKTGRQLSLVNSSDTLDAWEIDQIIYGGL